MKRRSRDGFWLVTGKLLKLNFCNCSTPSCQYGPNGIGCVQFSHTTASIEELDNGPRSFSQKIVVVVYNFDVLLLQSLAVVETNKLAVGNLNGVNKLLTL